MKKLFTSLFICIAIVLSSGALFTGCTPRSEILRIGNWGEYMPEEVYNGFASWYKEETGNNVVVQYDTYDTNETMYRQVAVQKYDYDVVCPSDYMVQRMIRENLLLKLDNETKTTVNTKITPAIVQMVKDSFDTNMEYSMPYVWGTMGIMYNANVTGHNEDSMKTWSVLWNESIAKKDGEARTYMKDSVRDTYAVASIYLNTAQLSADSTNFTNYDSTAYQNRLKSLFATVDQASIDSAKTALITQKEFVYSYEVDSAKEEMLLDVDGNDGKFGVFWSCDAGYIMNGDEQNANHNLRYIIPVEGSNVWVDNFVIPKYAVNTTAANMFIQYLCQTQVAYDCMDYVGSSTAVNAAATQYKADLEEDIDGFFEGTPAGFKENFISVFFPSEQTLKRCAIMKDFGDFNSALDKMWNDVYVQ